MEGRDVTLLRRRAAHRSCRLHGDNGCEIQGEAGPRERHHDDRAWRDDVIAELVTLSEELDLYERGRGSMSETMRHGGPGGSSVA